MAVCVNYLSQFLDGHEDWIWSGPGSIHPLLVGIVVNIHCSRLTGATVVRVVHGDCISTNLTSVGGNEHNVRAGSVGMIDGTLGGE